MNELLILAYRCELQRLFREWCRSEDDYELVQGEIYRIHGIVS